MRSKKLQVWLPLLFALVMVAGMAIGFQLSNKTFGNKLFSSNRPNSVQEVVELINSKYVDKLKKDSINQLAIEELLTHLDPHSIYIPASYLKRVNDDLKGQFQGIGIEFQQFNDTLNVMFVLRDSPAEKAGLKIGDQFIRINDTNELAGKNVSADSIRKLLRGEASSTVKITLLRDGILKDIVVGRGNIPVSTIDAAYMMDDKKSGYIRINKFGERTYEEFMQSLEKLQKNGAAQLIIDLRGNGGGFLNEAVQIADEFIDGNKMIVYTEGDKSSRSEYAAKRPGIFEKGKVVVLVDESSASASEVLAGALQDWDRATIIGRRSFGKGLVQQQFGLSDGSALRLTIARYYTPLGRNIQKPYNKNRDAYENELVERVQHGGLTIGDTTKPKGKAYKTPSGKTVFGGGGITPDIFVPIDTTAYADFQLPLYRKNTLVKFVYALFKGNSNLYLQQKNTEALVKVFSPGLAEWQQLVQFAAKDSVDLSKATLVQQKDLLKRVQSLMGRQILRTEGYFELVNKNDPVIKEALNSLR